MGIVMGHKINLAVTCLHISASIYFLLGLGGFAFSFVVDPSVPASDVAILWIGIAMCVGFGAFVEVVAWGLRNRKFWAWIAGLIVFALYVPSLFIPLGVLGLMGLLNEASRREFGMAPARDLD